MWVGKSSRQLSGLLFLIYKIMSVCYCPCCAPRQVMLCMEKHKSYFKVTAGRYLLDLFNAHCCNLICLLCLHFSEQKKALRCRFHYPSLSLKQLLKVLFNSHQRLFGYGQLTSVRGKKICASHRRRGGLKMFFCCFSVSDQRSSFTTPLEPAEQYVAKPHPTALCLQLHKTRTFFFLRLCLLKMACCIL